MIYDIFSAKFGFYNISLITYESYGRGKRRAALSLSLLGFSASALNGSRSLRGGSSSSSLFKWCCHGHFRLGRRNYLPFLCFNFMALDQTLAPGAKTLAESTVTLALQILSHTMIMTWATGAFTFALPTITLVGGTITSARRYDPSTEVSHLSETHFGPYPLVF